ncbi:hypothetical protein [Micromonospora sediminimaris]|uniref:Uncharacterized protein n=1 Tax=Micromonospora sediminimaris TaxID=547162 RepID=A0A9W5UR40_9ACTN|nr:hypothetical protein [Micromonospora sediminimaris]GIJ32708.1 hypothetical protein Vse01_18560 [Micromonospora sediminimaris]SFD15985.1 hypothetical protein SAMN05216284_11214 [Micromonospora sediminimaris]
MHVTPIRGESGVDQWRATAGLAPLATYLSEMAAICAEADDQPLDRQPLARWRHASHHPYPWAGYVNMMV